MVVIKQSGCMLESDIILAKVVVIGKMVVFGKGCCIIKLFLSCRRGSKLRFGGSYVKIG